jgi:hypothetical protein
MCKSWACWRWFLFSAVVLVSGQATQQSMHPTCGSLRDLQAFFWLWVFSTSQSESTPTHTRVTQTVSPFLPFKCKKEKTMLNVDMSNYKRFFTSIGLALITLSVLLPWLVLKEPFLVTIKASEISDLTWLGQYNVWLRQFMSLSLSILSCCLSPVFFFSGFALLFISLPTWIISETLEQRLETQIRRLELKGMKNKDTQLAQEQELLLRSNLKSKIELCFPKDICEIQETPKIDFITRYDMVLHFPNNISPDILVKITYTRANPNIKLFEKYLRLFVTELMKRKNRRAVIIILHEKLPNKSGAIFDFLKRPDVIIQDISESEVASMTSEKLLRLFFPENMYPVFPWKQLSE